MGYIVTYKSSYQLNGPPPIILLYPSPPIPGIFQQVSFFHFQTRAHNIPTIFTPYTLSLVLHLPTGTNP
jgi:hypothetical protein